MRKIVMIAINVVLIVALVTSAFQMLATSSAADGWTLVTSNRSLKAYPDLVESSWQKTPTMPPNGQYDKIGLHRLVKTGTTPKGAVFIVQQYALSGEEAISNPATDPWTKTENDTQAIYWANRGFDVYAFDYRHQFIPITMNASELSFMKDWGWDVYVSDVKEGVEKAKAISGASKVFVAAYSQGAGMVVNYATKHWKEDLKGIILESPYLSPVTNPVIAKRGGETNKYNLTLQLSNMTAFGNWATENAQLSTILMMKYALENPGAPAEYPPGTPLTPAVNPLTNRSWANITERNAYYYSVIQPSTNILGGYGNVTLYERAWAVMCRWIPSRLAIESSAWIDWVNCPYMAFDYDDHYAEIGVPVIAFRGQYSTNTSFANGINNTDFTGTFVPRSGVYDIQFGTYSARDVSEPAYQWMLGHLSSLDVSAFQSVKVLPGWTWWFFAQNLGGSAPYNYQWYEGLNPIQGQTSMILPVTKTAPGVYRFYCRVTDQDGTTTTSNAVTLTVMG